MEGLILKVNGLGEIRISDCPEWSCGNKKGFSFDIKETHEQYFLGGVLSKEDALNLADHIYEKLKINML